MIGKIISMAKEPKTNLFDVIKHFINIIFQRVTSIPGRVNIGFGFFIVLVIFLVIAQPIAFYILQIIQSVLNAALVYFQKEPIPLSEGANTILVLIICLAILMVETVFCSLLVHWSDIKKKELSKKTQ